MAKIKLSGENLTEHFTFADYGKNQTGTIPIDAAALLHAQLLEEFRAWLGRPMEVHAWYRTKEYNKKVGSMSTSSHIKGPATDWSTNIEAGLYSWGVHFGSQITYSKKFYHWDSRSGTQVNMPFKELK